MLIRSEEGVYKSELLSSLPFVRHGFASRRAGLWPGEYTRVKQVHSALVAVSDGHSVLPEKADAIVTAVRGQWVGIRTADCVPLLIADRAGRGVAAVHAGWRGTVANIAAESVRKLADICGCVPGDLLVAIGPCISRCCYEVGAEVSGQFRPLFGNDGDLSRIDLIEANRRQLIAAGIAPDAIDTSDLCTFCDAGEFHSYRRDREASGRMVAAIALT